MKRARKKLYRQTASLHGKRTTTLDETGLSFTGPAFSSRVEWAFFPRFVEDQKTFLLYQSNQVFNIIPKQQLSQEQISELREAFNWHIGMKS
ncbi:MAG: YcxB family protein [Candidatus Angelobacter sp.]